MFVLLGVEVTGQLFNRSLLLFYDGGPVTNLGSPNAESELRFFSVFWIAYGGVLIQTAQDLTRHWRRVPLLLGLFFAGGAARLIGYFAVGQPHVLFILLMIIELTLPVILYLCWRAAKAP